jgi:hypothetical protein
MNESSGLVEGEEEITASAGNPQQPVTVLLIVAQKPLFVKPEGSLQSFREPNTAYISESMESTPLHYTVPN